MRISSIIRVLENQVVAIAGKTAAVTVNAYSAAEAEYRAQQLVKATLKSKREALLVEARSVVAALDDLKTSRVNGAFDAALREFRAAREV